MARNAHDPISPPPGGKGAPAPRAPAIAVSVDRDRALERLMDLLTISAPTGEEKAVQTYLIGAIAGLGIPAESVKVDDAPARIALPCQTGNLIIQLPGSAPGPRRLISAHMDTVPLAKNAEPVIRGERIVAMGQSALGGDDRTGVAAALTALDTIQRRGLPHPPLTFLFTIREESGLRGAMAARPEDLGRPAMGFNFDGSRPDEITVGATGSMRLEIEVRGLAAHAGVHPERGISAVAIFAQAAAALDRDGWLGLVKRPEGTGTSNIGVVRGGEATNVITHRLHARAEARSHQPEFLKRIVDEYRRAFAESAAAHKNEAGKRGEAHFEVEESYTSFALDEAAPAVQVALSAARAIGLEPRTRLSNGGLDANWLTRHGIPTVSLGCGQHEIHTVDEYVDIAEYLTACRLALALATG